MTSDIPTLVISSEFDPITPPAYGTEAAQTLSKSFVFEVPRASHGSSVTEDCPRSMVAAFIDNPAQKPDAACFTDMAKTTFAVPPKAADFKLIPFSEGQMNLSSVVPDGWKQIGPGAYTPTGKATDSIGLVQQAVPVPADTVMGLLKGQFKSSDINVAFEQSGTRSANGIDWKLYSADVQVSTIDLALGEKDGTTYLVMLQGPLNDHKVLYDAVFLPAVDALKSAK